MAIGIVFCYFSLKPYVVTPHLNRLDETVQMRVTTYVLRRINKNIPTYHQILPHLRPLRSLVSHLNAGCKMLIIQH